MKLRDVVSELRTHGRDRTWWRKRFLTHIVSRYYDVVGSDGGDSILQRDWDTLLILDACRFDLFEDVYDSSSLPGTLSERTSLETGTPGFLTETFGDGTYHDIVYVTANPYVETKLESEQFHAVENVWKDGWDDEHSTVLPEVMCERALDAAEKYPRKRLIVHFLQPHYPFIGDVSLGQKSVFPSREQALGNTDAVQQNPTPFELLERGDVTKDEVWKAYRSNLERAMPSVETLLSELQGKTAVTSDHGNALGEYASPFPIRVYGHPLGILIPALTSVPWLEHTNGERREIQAEPPVVARSTDSVDAETEQRLRMLGYTE
jgi:hypothetical protein